MSAHPPHPSRHAHLEGLIVRNGKLQLLKIPPSVSLPPFNTWSGTTSAARGPSPEALPTVVAEVARAGISHRGSQLLPLPAQRHATRLEGMAVPRTDLFPSLFQMLGSLLWPWGVDVIISISASGSGKHEERVTCDPKAGGISSDVDLGWGAKGPPVSKSLPGPGKMPVSQNPPARVLS